MPELASVVSGPPQHNSSKNARSLLHPITRMQKTQNCVQYQYHTVTYMQQTHQNMEVNAAQFYQNKSIEINIGMFKFKCFYFSTV